MRGLSPHSKLQEANGSRSAPRIPTVSEELGDITVPTTQGRFQLFAHKTMMSAEKSLEKQFYTAQRGFRNNFSMPLRQVIRFTPPTACTARQTGTMASS